MNTLERTLIRSNARYFWKARFISGVFYRRVLEWVDGNPDMEVQLRVARWMRLDARWAKEIEQSSIRHFWYIAPAVVIVISLVRRMLIKRAKELRGDQ